MIYRKEIDGLRALAVIPVVFYHAGIGFFSGGYVGVDVFFVISGFLITSLILKETSDGNFSLLSFYERRARRLLPALFFMMIICIPFAWILLIPSELESFGKSLISTSFFFSNILFWQESGYFSSPSDLKPLIHTWSLSVEEQYYLLFPFLFSLFSKNIRHYLIIFLIIIFFISLFSSNWAAYNKPSANFYLLPTRVWEILSGAILAFYVTRNFILIRRKLIRNLLSIFGLILIIFSIITFNDTTPFPSFYTLFPVLGTLLIISFADSSSILGKFLSNKFLVFIGLISYSLYLWHQPLLAFTRHYLGESLSNLNIFVILLSSLIISIISYFFVESPFRKNRQRFSRSFIFKISIFSMLAISSVGLIIDQTKGFRSSFVSSLDLEIRDRFEELEVNAARNFFEDIRNENCNFWSNKVDENFKKNFDRCQKKYGEATIVIGDSHAINLFNILHEKRKINFLVGVSDGGCRIHHEWRCFYDDFLYFLNKDSNFGNKIIYHQSGIYLIDDRFGNSNSVESLREIGPPRINYGSINKIIEYLDKLQKNSSIFWLGPHPENIENLSSKILKNKNLILEKNAILKNSLLSRNLEDHLKDKQMINFISFDKLYKIDTDFLIKENCLTFRDRDHFSICGEKLISKNIQIKEFEL